MKKPSENGFKNKIYSFIPCKISNKTVLSTYEYMRKIQKIVHGNYKDNYEYNKTNYKKHHAKIKASYGFIEIQRDLFDLKYGSTTVAYAGCEVIAVYNAIVAMETKPQITFTELIRAFEKDGMVFGGRFGTSPRALRDYLNKAGYETTFSDDVLNFDRIATDSKCSILTIYNDGKDIRKMIHTITLSKQDNKYVAHNVYCNGKPLGPYKSVSEFINSVNNKRAKGIYIIGINK